ncbi:MAG: hypothetical protein Q6J68_02765 [Thermostichales cyanobacterium SZTDM-1c_bins_54]
MNLSFSKAVALGLLLWGLGDPPSWAQSPSVVLEALPLFPDAELAADLETRFSQQLAAINAQIGDRQAVLQALLMRWESDEGQIRRLQARLSQLRTERDRLALEHLLLMRQLQENFVIPNYTRSPSPSPSPSGVGSQ